MPAPLPGHRWRAGDVAYRQARLTGSHAPAAEQDPVQKETGDTQRLTDISPPLPHPSCHKKYTICSFWAIHEDAEASTMGFMSYRVYLKG